MAGDRGFLRGQIGQVGQVGVDGLDPAPAGVSGAGGATGDALSCELVEDAGVFAPHRPTGRRRPYRLAFVGGAMRTEARLTHTGPGGQTSPGLAASWAAGAVLVGESGPASIDSVTVGRTTIFTNGQRVRLPDHRDGWRWEPRAVPGSDVLAARQRLQRLMRESVAALAGTLCRDGWLTILDGPVHSIRARRGLPIIGYVKTHARRLLAPQHWVEVPRLEVGERSGLFAVDTDVLACYLRVGYGGRLASRWVGIVRIEAPAGIGKAAAVEALDRAAGWLPDFATPLHRHTGAPAKLAPITGLARHLRHRQGEPRLALRAVQDAAAQRNGEATP